FNKPFLFCNFETHYACVFALNKNASWILFSSFNLSLDFILFEYWTKSFFGQGKFKNKNDRGKS
ncbi:hypothetical protein BpHYR1_031365, partial [Brachionus plicatilis]